MSDFTFEDILENNIVTNERDKWEWNNFDTVSRIKFRVHHRGSETGGYSLKWLDQGLRIINSFDDGGDDEHALEFFDYLQQFTKKLIKIYYDLSDVESDLNNVSFPIGNWPTSSQKMRVIKACREFAEFYNELKSDREYREVPNNRNLFKSWVNVFCRHRINGETLIEKLNKKGFSSDPSQWEVHYGFKNKSSEEKGIMPLKEERLGDFRYTSPAPEMSKAEKIVAEAVENSLDGKKQVIFTGAPGTGKTYSVERYVDSQLTEEEKDTRKKLVQFHSSFDYTDFVEGLRPIRNEKGEMGFVRMDGVFKAFCRKAAADPDNLYYFIIDEINRADLGRVFGELMYCFEKRGEKHRVQTQFSNLPTYDPDNKKDYDEDDDVFSKKKNGFYIPENVIILGTMNDIDRSVETFDFALRRRFDWVEIDAEDIMESSLESMCKNEDIYEMPDVGKIKEMNKVIADKEKYGLGREFMIGPAYFKGYDGNIKDIWERNIRPILYEYMRGRQNADNLVENCGKALWGETAYNEYIRTGKGQR